MNKSWLKKQLAGLPEKPGVYLFRDKKGSVIYIGKAANLKKRIKSHFSKNSPFFMEPKVKPWCLSLRLVGANTPHQSTNPPTGRSSGALGAGKEKLLVADTVKIDCLETGKELDAFLIENELIKKHQPKFNVKLRDDKTYPYLAISHEDIPRVFITRKKSPSADFFGPFPRAKLLKQELRLLRRLFPFRSCRRIPKRPCLYKDLNLCFCRQYSVGALAAVLGRGRAEGYDISNLAGKMATGAMVVFIDGKPAKDQYRQFRIRTKFSPDDPAMIREVLSRRLIHKEWEKPSLIIIDGGEGQLDAAITALNRAHQQIPVIALAKKEEEIYYKTGKRKTSKLKLPSFSLFLPLLQRVRDEAHRFALRYHRKLRQKEVFEK